MGYRWVDSQQLALDLIEIYPDVDPLTVSFTQLRQWVMALDNFDDNDAHCGERILEAIQMAWVAEID